MNNFLKPNEILNNLELSNDMIAADFGCGTGGWAIPLAKKLEEGKVYALDIQEEMLSALKSHAQLEKIYNIETRLCDLETENGSGLPENSLDLALLTNILFQIEDKKIVLQEMSIQGQCNIEMDEFHDKNSHLIVNNHHIYCRTHILIDLCTKTLYDN